MAVGDLALDVPNLSRDDPVLVEDPQHGDSRHPELSREGDWRERANAGDATPLDQCSVQGRPLFDVLGRVVGHLDPNTAQGAPRSSSMAPRHVLIGWKREVVDAVLLERRHAVEGPAQHVLGPVSEGVGHQCDADHAPGKGLEVFAESGPVMAREDGIATHRIHARRTRHGAFEDPTPASGQFARRAELRQRLGVVRGAVAGVNGIRLKHRSHRTCARYAAKSFQIC